MEKNLKKKETKTRSRSQGEELKRKRWTWELGEPEKAIRNWLLAQLLMQILRMGLEKWVSGQPLFTWIHNYLRLVGILKNYFLQNLSALKNE